jgi:hypothetical protein
MYKIQQKIDSIQIPAGYAVSAGVGTTPLWVSNLTDWLELLAIFFAVLVGATTAYLNYLKIRRERSKD